MQNNDEKYHVHGLEDSHCKDINSLQTDIKFNRISIKVPAISFW